MGSQSITIYGCTKRRTLTSNLREAEVESFISGLGWQKDLIKIMKKI